MADDEKEKPQHRKVKPVEEKAKRGRWVIIVALLLTLILSYCFSLGNR
jgi:uncharacterized integral membrane protein